MAGRRDLRPWLDSRRPACYVGRKRSARSMMIHLSDEQEEVVRSLVEEGRYASADEVIDEALRLLQERDDQARLADLRREIAMGLGDDPVEPDPSDPHPSWESPAELDARVERERRAAWDEGQP